MSERDEAFGEVALALDQVRNLTLALQTVLEVECEDPLEGHQAGALALAIQHAAEYAQSVFLRRFDPDQKNGRDG